jgi:hypothetical protein
VPERRPAAANEALYDLAPDEVESTSMSAQPVVAAPAVSYARRQTIGESSVDRFFPDRVKDLYLPLALIAGGTLIEVIAAIVQRQAGLPQAMVMVGVWMILNTVIMLLTVMVVAKIRSINFGPFATAIIKLCGISIGPDAVGTLVSLVLAFIPFSGVIGWLISCVIYFALIGALFDLDESDTWVVVLSVFFVKLALIVGIFIFFA